MDWLGKALEVVANKVGGDWLANLILIGILAWAARGLGPPIINAYVKDRESKRRHAERMKELENKFERRTEAKPPGKTRNGRRRGRSR